MNAFLRLFIAVTATFAIGHPVIGQGFTHTFEAPSWSPGDSIDKTFSGVPEWQVRNGQAKIATEGSVRPSNPSGSASAQALRLVGGSRPAVEVLRVKNDITTDFAFVDFAVKPVAEPSTEMLSSVHVNGVHLAFVEQMAMIQLPCETAPKSRPTGYGIVLVEDFNGPGGASSWRDTHWIFPFQPGTRKARDWMRVTIFNDPPDSNARVCDISINGYLMAARVTPQPLSPLLTHSLFFGTESSADVFIDDFSAGANSPFGSADSDKDGLPDAWENLRGIPNANGINGLLDEVAPGGTGPGGKTWAQILAEENAVNPALQAPPADDDGDGIPNYWEDYYQRTETSPANGLKRDDASDKLADPDRDGVSNLEEFLLGTNPLSQPVYAAAVMEEDAAVLTTSIQVTRDYNPPAPGVSTTWVALYEKLYSGDYVTRLVRMDYGKEPVVSTISLGTSVKNIYVTAIAADGTVAGNCYVYMPGAGPVQAAFIRKTDGTYRVFAGKDYLGQTIVATTCVGLKDTGEAFGTVTNADYSVNFCSFTFGNAYYTGGLIERISTASMPTSGTPRYQLSGMTPDGWVYGTRVLVTGPRPFVMALTSPLSSATVQVGTKAAYLGTSGAVEGPWIPGAGNTWIKSPSAEFNLPSPGAGRTWMTLAFAGGNRAGNPLLRLTRSYDSSSRYYAHVTAADNTASAGPEIQSLPGVTGGVFPSSLNMSRETVGSAIDVEGNGVPFVNKFGVSRPLSAATSSSRRLRLTEATLICGNGDVLGLGLVEGRTRLLRLRFLADTDGDGMSDEYELSHQLNRYDAADAALDTDGDGASNLKEFLAGSDPHNRDTDGDGIPDGWEIDNDLNPLDPADAGLDYDGDHLTNRQEFLNNSNPFTPLQFASGGTGVDQNAVEVGNLSDGGQVVGWYQASGQSPVGFQWNGAGTPLITWTDFFPNAFTSGGVGGKNQPAGGYYAWPQVRTDAGAVLRTSPATDGSNSYTYLDCSRGGDLLYMAFPAGATENSFRLAAGFGGTETTLTLQPPPWALSNGVQFQKVAAEAPYSSTLPSSYNRLVLGYAVRDGGGTYRLDTFVSRVASPSQTATFETITLAGGNTAYPAAVDASGRVLASYDGMQGWCFHEGGIVKPIELGTGNVVDMNDKKEILFLDYQLGPCLWRNGRAMPLQRLLPAGSALANCYARAINNNGQILIESPSALSGKRTFKLLKYADDLNGNGLPDDWEKFYWSSGYTVVPGADDDGDLLTNAEEFARGTDPRRQDTDNDGLLDKDDPDPLIADPLPNANSLVLNEICSKNFRCYVNPFGQTAMDWFEVHLPATAQADGEGRDISDYGICYLSGASPSSMGHETVGSEVYWFPSGTKIQPGGYLVVNACRQDEIPESPLAKTHAADPANMIRVREFPDVNGVSRLWKELYFPRRLTTDGAIIQLVHREPGGSTSNTEFHFQGLPADNTLSLAADLKTTEVAKATPGKANIVDPPSWTVSSPALFLPNSSMRAPGTLSIPLPSAPDFQYVLWTVDGSEPLPGNAAARVSRPGDTLIFNTTTVLRMCAFRNDSMRSEMVSRSYLFREDVLTQRNPAGITGENNHAIVPGTNDTPDLRVPFKMDLVQAATNEQISGGGSTLAGLSDPGLDPDGTDPELPDLPVVSIISDQDGLFGKENGIYTNSRQKGDAWERPATAEFIGAGLATGSSPCVVALAGNASREPGLTRKHSLRLKWRRATGLSRLDRSDLLPGSTGKFDSLVLRAPVFDGWSREGEQRINASYLREQWVHETLRGFTALRGTPALPPQPRARPVNLFLNGLYWGVYWLGEDPDADFLKRAWKKLEHVDMHDDWDPEFEDSDFDVIEDGVVKSGDSVAWDELQKLASDIRESTASTGFVAPVPPSTWRTDTTATQDLYNQVAGRLDIPQFIDYVLINLFFMNEDWPDNNWVACRLRPYPLFNDQMGVTPWKFRFLPKDSEMTAGLHFKAASPSALARFFRNPPDNGVAALFHNLSASATFRQALDTRAYYLFFAGGHAYDVGAIAETDGPARTSLNLLADAVRPGLLLESARWGRTPYLANACGPGKFETEFTALVSWLTDKDGLAAPSLGYDIRNYLFGGNGVTAYYSYQNPLGDSSAIAGSASVRRNPAPPSSLASSGGGLAVGNSGIDSPADSVQRNWTFTGTAEVHPDLWRAVKISVWDTVKREWQLLKVTPDDGPVTVNFSFQVVEYANGTLDYPRDGVLRVDTIQYQSSTTHMDPDYGKLWMYIAPNPASPVFWVPSVQHATSTRFVSPAPGAPALLLENPDPDGTTGGLYGHLESAFLHVARQHDGTGALEVIPETEPPAGAGHDGYPARNRKAGTPIEIKSIPPGGLLDKSVSLGPVNTKVRAPLRR